MTACFLRWAAAAAACAVLAACGGSGDIRGAVTPPPNSLAERYDAANALGDRVEFLVDSEGFTRTSRLPRGSATYRGQAGFVLAASQAQALALIEDPDLEVEDIAWLARATLDADFERYTVSARYDDFMGQRNERLSGALTMAATPIVTDAFNEATFRGTVTGSLQDSTGRIDVQGISDGAFVGDSAQAIAAAMGGSATRPGGSPRVLVGAIAAER